MNRKVYTNPEDFFRQNEALDTGLPYAEDVSVLSAPLRVGNKTIRNRLACQAMEGCDGTLSGEPDVLTKRRYDRFARKPNGSENAVHHKGHASHVAAVLQQCHQEEEYGHLRQETKHGSYACHNAICNDALQLWAALQLQRAQHAATEGCRTQ